MLELVEENRTKLLSFRERRCMLKLGIEYANNFTREGIYSCRARNIRGGSLVMEKWSVPTAVFVEQPEPYLLKVFPAYVPRKLVIRKKWSSYSSINGWFNKGRIGGIVTIMYLDKSGTFPNVFTYEISMS